MKKPRRSGAKSTMRAAEMEETRQPTPRHYQKRLHSRGRLEQKTRGACPSRAFTEVVTTPHDMTTAARQGSGRSAARRFGFLPSSVLRLPSPAHGINYVVLHDIHETMLDPGESDHPLAAVGVVAQTPRDVAANFYLHTRLAEVDVAVTAQLKARIASSTIP